MSHPLTEKPTSSPGNVGLLAFPETVPSRTVSRVYPDRCRKGGQFRRGDTMGYTPISEYAIVGNDDRVALVSQDGSIDWCCFPHVAAPSVFARLLDDECGGHFAVRPTDTHRIERDYLEGTNILETTFETRSGRATLTDFMPVAREDQPEQFQHAIYRRIHCEEGALTMEAEFEPRLGYAKGETAVEWDEAAVEREEEGTSHVVATGGHEWPDGGSSGDETELHLQVYGSLDLDPRGDRAVGTATLTEGETVWFVCQYDHVTPRTPEECAGALDETTAYWRDWVEGVEAAAETIAGDEPWHEEVVRSALVLKLLINEGSGAIYAAATTSLPETYGGTRNWDYRYNWIRDAKFTVQALYNLGRTEEAGKYFEWFREIGHDDPGEIQPLYGVHGERDLTEHELDHLAGYRYSAPVRVGNAATEQRQIDVYGAIVQGIYETLRQDEQLTDADWGSIRKLVDHVADVWDEPDEGIWEFRDQPRHYLHSKLLCWVALDRGIELAGQCDREAPIDRWHEEREAVRETILEQGYSEQVGSFVQHFETDEALDATCLLIPIYEFLPADDPRVESTLDTVLDRLATDDGMVHRTRDSEAVEEEHGTFVFCTFWLVDALVLAGRIEEAREIFENTLEHTTPLELLSERIDPETGELFGNFPQAYSHIGLINSAIYLASAEDGGLEHDPREHTPDDLQPLFRTDSEE